MSEQPPLDDEGAAPRLKVVVERFAAAIDDVLDRVFDEPLDIRSAHEARAHLHAQPSSFLSSALAAQGVQWAMARSAATKAGAKLVARMGGVAGRKVILPVTVAVDIGLGAREGLRELQILRVVPDQSPAGGGSAHRRRSGAPYHHGDLPRAEGLSGALAQLAFAGARRVQTLGPPRHPRG